ncbi:uncharacterized protein LOC135206723 [Macrobrachium nipponense]|uniref:uncharacterized protein LOC135206723 n=1 Tax=Macrobrachium nipponense TaxID=159736 RepID=UPI0030C84E87
MPLIARRWTYFILLVLSSTYSLTTQHRQVQYFAGDNLEDLPSRGERRTFPSPTNLEVQELRRFKRFTESRPSNVPSVASIIDSPNQRAQGRPPVVVLDRVNQPPTREQILWRKIAELRAQNRNNPTAPVSQTRGNPVASAPAPGRPPGGHPHPHSRPDGFTLTQSGGTIVINDQDLASTFDRCGQYLEHCLGHVPGHIHGHQHHHHGSTSNGRTAGVSHTPVSFSPGHNHRHHQHNRNPPFMNFNGQQIPVWPG